MSIQSVFYKIARAAPAPTKSAARGASLETAPSGIAEPPVLAGPLASVAVPPTSAAAHSDSLCPYRDQHDIQTGYGCESYILATIPDVHPGTTIVACVTNSFAIAAAIASVGIVAAICWRLWCCADTQACIAGCGLTGEEGRGAFGEGESGRQEKAESEKRRVMHVEVMRRGDQAGLGSQSMAEQVIFELSIS
jgi:hypothetical protein